MRFMHKLAVSGTAMARLFQLVIFFQILGILLCLMVLIYECHDQKTSASSTCMLTQNCMSRYKRARPYLIVKVADQMDKQDDLQIVSTCTICSNHCPLNHFTIKAAQKVVEDFVN